MAIRFFSEDVLLVNLPAQPQQSDEFEMLNTMFCQTVDHHVVMDFSDVQMLTSESLCGLLILARLLRGAERELVLCGVPAPIDDIFNRTGLRSVFVFADSEADALARLKDREVSWTGA